MNIDKNYKEYEHKYLKYKRKYLDLIKRLQKEGRYRAPPSVEREAEYMEEDILITPVYEDYPGKDFPYYWIPDPKGSLEIQDEVIPKKVMAREYRTEDAGLEGEARWKKRKLYKFSEDEFISFNDEPDKTKILRIDDLDDFDNFTQKYGELKIYEDKDPRYGKQELIIINWGRVADKYKGIYISEGLEAERGGIAYLNGKTYPSWWNNSFTYEDVLVFQPLPPPIIIPKGQIKKPFRAEIYTENDFMNDEYVKWYDSFGETQERETESDNEDKNKKILWLDTYDGFDEFTNRYGDLYEAEDSGNTYIKIDWNSVASDFKGFVIDKDNLIRKNRYKKAFFTCDKYECWWFKDKLKAGNVYIFK